MHAGSVSAPFSRRLCSPVTPLVQSRITKKHGLSHTHETTHERGCSSVRFSHQTVYIYGCCRGRRHCYDEGAFRDVTFDPKYKCKILLKSPDTGVLRRWFLFCAALYTYIIRIICISCEYTTTYRPPAMMPPLPSLHRSSCNLYTYY